MTILHLFRSPEWRELRVPVVVVAAAFAAGLVVSAAAYFLVDESDRSDYWLEVGKAGMQTVVVAAIGTIATAALKYAEDQRATARQVRERKEDKARLEEEVRRQKAEKQRDIQREEARLRNDYRLGLLRRLRSAYSAIKRVRRELEHAGFKPLSSTPFVPVSGPASPEAKDAYRLAMAELREVKLDLEAMREELEAGVGLGGTAGLLKGKLHAMEAYIDNEVIDEHREIPASAMESLDLLQVEGLQRFVAAAHVAFWANVSHPYHEAARVLVADIVGPPADTVPATGPPGA